MPAKLPDTSMAMTVEAPKLPSDCLIKFICVVGLIELLLSPKIFDYVNKNPAYPPKTLCSLKYLSSEIPENSSVRWGVSSEDNSSPHVGLEGCDIYRYTHKQVLARLTDKVIVFVGDSVTRYQYLSLALFIETGQWPLLNGSDTSNPINEKSWGSWKDFFKGTNVALNGHEHCDCYCKEIIEIPSLPEFLKNWVENRYYHHHHSTIVYIAFAHEPSIPNMKGHVEFPYGGNESLCSPGACLPPVDWQLSLPTAFNLIVAPLQPDLIVLNSGLWSTSNEWSEIELRRVFANGKAALRRGGSALWKTTTQKRDYNMTTRDEKATVAALEAGWGILDAYALTKNLPPEAYWDTLHFNAYVYRELNMVMLNLVATLWG